MKRYKWENILYNITKPKKNNKKYAEYFIEACDNINTDKAAKYEPDIVNSNVQVIKKLCSNLGINKIVLQPFNNDIDQSIITLTLQRPTNDTINNQKRILSLILKEKTLELDENAVITKDDIPDNIDTILNTFYNVKNDNDKIISNMLGVLYTYFYDLVKTYEEIDLIQLYKNIAQTLTIKLNEAEDLTQNANELLLTNINIKNNELSIISIISVILDDDALIDDLQKSIIEKLYDDDYLEKDIINDEFKNQDDVYTQFAIELLKKHNSNDIINYFKNYNENNGLAILYTYMIEELNNE